MASTGSGNLPESDSLICARCGAPVDAAAVECGSCRGGQVDEKVSVDAPEFDHRGIQMPARTRVGGIIIPQ